jgi:hypothetical protein
MPMKPPSGQIGCGKPASGKATILCCIAFCSSAAFVGLMAAMAFK